MTKLTTQRSLRRVPDESADFRRVSTQRSRVPCTALRRPSAAEAQPGRVPAQDRQATERRSSGGDDADGALPAVSRRPLARGIAMNGCSAAIAAAQRYRDAVAQCPAKNHRGKCRRVGGTKQCGECARDVLPLKAPANRLGAPPDGMKAVSATPQRQGLVVRRGS